MRKQYKLSRRRSRRVFRQTAGRTHKRNFKSSAYMRGGIRM